MPDDNQDKTQSHVILTKGTMVAHYRIVEKIGAGGMGEIYLAEDTKLNRKVALKFMPAHLAQDKEVRARFTREAQAVAKLNHPNIVTIHEVSEYNGRPFFVMEHIEGKSLHHYAHKEPLPFDTIVDYAIQICQGLGEAHRHGIIHRDIKAANISVDRSNRIRLLDFGLAAVQGDEKLTKSGSTLGTVAYMSPEQVAGRKIDHRSDIFSLGIVLYELIAGRTPFRRDSEGATLKAIIEDNVEPLSRYKADVPDKLRDVVFKLLEKDKELRYQSAEGVIADLKRLVYDSQPSQRPDVTVPPLTKRPITYILAAVAIVIVIAGYFLTKLNSQTAAKDKPVLAVLPFTNLGSEEDEYFSEGITNEIRSRLNTLEGVRILSPNSVEKYRGTDKTAEEIGRELNADYLLEGTIRWDKSSEVERLRITPVLTQASNNYQLWSENYQRTLTEIFAVQAEIADQIARQLGVTLLNPQQYKDPAAPTENLEAYNYYLRGLELAHKSIFKVVYLRPAIHLFDSAIALDSDFALAWAQKSKAMTEHAFGFFGFNDPFVLEAKEAAEKALALDPHLTEGHIALGAYYNFIESDFDRALAEFDKVDPGKGDNADLKEAIGIVVMRRGQWEKAISYFEDAARIDPLNTRPYYWLATSYGNLRNFAKANQYLNRSYALSPDNTEAVYLKMFLNLMRFGRIEGSGYMFKELTGLSGVAKASSWRLSLDNSFGLWRFLPKKFYSNDMIKVVQTSKANNPLYNYYLNTGELYRLMEKPDTSRMYFDSARTLLEKISASSPDDYHILAVLGLAYARVGDFDKAEKAGKKAKELMSVDDCHW